MGQQIPSIVSEPCAGSAQRPDTPGPGRGLLTPNPPLHRLRSCRSPATHRPRSCHSPAPQSRPCRSPAPLQSLPCPSGPAPPLTGPAAQPGPGLQLRVPAERRGRFLPAASDWSAALSIKARPQDEHEDWLSCGGGICSSLWAQGSEGPGGRSRVPPLGWSWSSGPLPGPELQEQPRPCGFSALSRWDSFLARLPVARTAAGASLRRMRKAPPQSHLKPAVQALRAHL